MAHIDATVPANIRFIHTLKSRRQWRRIANLGDVNPLDYGGYFIYEDRTRVYAPEGEYLLTPEDSGSNEYLCYRFSLDRCQMVDGYLVPARYDATWPHAVSQYDEWFHRDLAKVAETIGTTVEDLRTQLCSADTLDRAHAYRAIGEYHGFENLDGYPRHYASRSALPRRIRRYQE